jgi:hypothetical protein
MPLLLFLSANLNYERVCVDSLYSAGNPVKVDLADGDVNVYQTQLEDCIFSQ